MRPGTPEIELPPSAMAAMPVALTRCSADLRYLWVSDRYAEWLGLPAAEIAGTPIVDIIGPEGMEAIRPYIDVVLAGKPAKFEQAVHYNRIGRRWIQAEYVPTFDARRAVDGWVACIVDITDRKRAEASLASAHGALARLFELSVMPGGPEAMPALLQAVVDAAIDVTDAEMGNVQLYDEATKTLRIVAHRGLERPFLDYFSAVHAGDAACGEAIRRREQVIVPDVWVSPLFDPPTLAVMKDASVRAVQSTLMLSREGRLLGVISTHWRTPRRPDVDRLRALEIVARQAADTLEHRRQQAQLEEADRRKDEFLAMLGHELRNPLAPIVTATEMMARRAGGVLEKERKVIEDQAKHMIRLVDDLLDVSRITRGKIELRKARVSIAQIVDKAVEMTAPLLEERAHRLTVDVPRDATVEADPARIVQVIANLLTNAASYTDRGGHVRLIGQADEATVTIRVADNGVGISPGLLPVMFRPFVQERQAIDRPRGGLGLGLAIVRSLVELHGGTVSARSDGIGKGSELTVVLPRLSGIDRAAEPASATPVAEATPRARILVVDDNQIVALSYVDALTELGNEVRVAHDGPSALREVERFTPTLAFIDIGLPVMDGYELARRLRELPALAGARLVAVSGYGEPSAVQRSMEAGFAAHLVKPVALAELEEVVRSAGSG